MPLIVVDTVLFDLCALTRKQPMCGSAFLCRESNSVEHLRDTCRSGFGGMVTPPVCPSLPPAPRLRNMSPSPILCWRSLRLAVIIVVNCVAILHRPVFLHVDFIVFVVLLVF